MKYTPQLRQWIRLGFAEVFIDEGETDWHWKNKFPYAIQCHLKNIAENRPLWPVPDEAERMKKYILEDVRKAGFDNQGFYLEDV